MFGAIHSLEYYHDSIHRYTSLYIIYIRVIAPLHDIEVSEYLHQLLHGKCI